MSLAAELSRAHRERRDRLWPVARARPIQIPEPVPPAEEPAIDVAAAKIEEDAAKIVFGLEQLRALVGPPAQPLPTVEMKPTISRIKRVVSAWSGVTVIDIESHRRTANVVRPRQVAMYLAKRLTTRTLPFIGRQFSDRDHTTVLHAVRKIGRLRESDRPLDLALTTLETVLKEQQVAA